MQLRARIYDPRTPRQKFLLQGTFVEESAVPGGWVVNFKGVGKWQYSFHSDNGALVGTDSEGGTYRLTLVK